MKIEIIKNKIKEIIKHPKTKKIMQIIINVLFYIIILSALFILMISITSKKDSDGTAIVFNHQLRFVQSDSMAKCDQTDVSKYKIKSLKLKTCIFIQVAPIEEKELNAWYDSLEVGDVLTIKYVYVKQETITHRIKEIKEKETGGYIIILEGDNKESDSNLLQQVIDTSQTNSTNYIVGKVVGQNYLLGLLVYSFKTPVGIICLIIIPCLIIISFEVIKIVRVISKEKRDKINEEQEKQNQTIEELKKQLEELRNKENERKEENSEQD